MNKVHRQTGLHKSDASAIIGLLDDFPEVILEYIDEVDEEEPKADKETSVPRDGNNGTD